MRQFLGVKTNEILKDLNYDLLSVITSKRTISKYQQIFTKCTKVILSKKEAEEAARGPLVTNINVPSI